MNLSYNITMEKIIRAYLIFGGFYMLGEALVHFSNIKLADVSTIWSKDALTFSSWISTLYGSTTLFMSLLLFSIQGKVEENKKIVKVLAFYALFHGVLVTYASLTIRFDEIFHNLSSLSFWLPTYNGYLLLESLLLFGFAFLVYLWLRK